MYFEYLRKRRFWRILCERLSFSSVLLYYFAALFSKELCSRQDSDRNCINYLPGCKSPTYIKRLQGEYKSQISVFFVKIVFCMKFSYITFIVWLRIFLFVCISNGQKKTSKTFLTKLKEQTNVLDLQIKLLRLSFSHV